MKSNIETTIETYNLTAEDYSEKTLGINTKGQIRKFLSHIPVNSYLLDLGCGPGRDAKIFSDNGYIVTGIDLSDKLLRIAGKHAPKAEFLNMDMLNLSFPDSYFDGIWAMSSLIHLEKNQLPEALAQCQRVIKTGGAFYLCFKKGEGESLEPDQRYGGLEKYYAYYQANELRNIINNTKFEILEFDGLMIEKNYANKPWMNILLKKVE